MFRMQQIKTMVPVQSLLPAYIGNSPTFKFVDLRRPSKRKKPPNSASAIDPFRHPTAFRPRFPRSTPLAGARARARHWRSRRPKAPTRPSHPRDDEHREAAKPQPRRHGDVTETKTVKTQDRPRIDTEPAIDSKRGRFVFPFLEDMRRWKTWVGETNSPLKPCE